MPNRLVQYNTVFLIRNTHRKLVADKLNRRDQRKWVGGLKIFRNTQLYKVIIFESCRQ